MKTFEASEYIAEVCALVEDSDREKLMMVAELLKNLNGKRVFLIGNGASSSIASHFALDLSKQAGLKALTCSDAPFMTALGNDLGFESVYAKFLEFYGTSGDVLITISCSGNSPNIVAAVDAGNLLGMKTIGLTGFSGNGLSGVRSTINLPVDSRSYNIIETLHTFYLSFICDAIIGKSEYGVS